MWMEHWWLDTEGKKWKCSQQNLSQYHFSHPESKNGSAHSKTCPSTTLSTLSPKMEVLTAKPVPVPLCPP